MVSCAKMAELIDMPFWVAVGPGNHVLDGDGADPPTGKWQFSGLVRAIQKHSQSSLQPSLLCVRCKRDHSIVSNIMQQRGSFSMSGKHK